jgi:metacaspase-1
MARGVALTIGLNAVDPDHYGGWSGDLNACEADAQDLAAIAQSRKFTTTTLLTRDATRPALIDALTGAARTLASGDIFLLAYSGHGGQIPDLNSDEVDNMDETWCLFDGELIDDELYKYLAKFKQGVRVLVFSDSCHSGTVTKAAYYRGTALERARDSGGQPIRYRYMPPEVALRTYRQHMPFYTGLQKSVKGKGQKKDVKASVLLLSGCQDNQTSADGTYNGLFTAQVLKVWNNGKFKGDYLTFHKKIVQRMPPDQTPNYYWVGIDDPKYRAQKPFTI